MKHALTSHHANTAFLMEVPMKGIFLKISIQIRKRTLGVSNSQLNLNTFLSSPNTDKQKKKPCWVIAESRPQDSARPAKMEYATLSASSSGTVGVAPGKYCKFLNITTRKRCFLHYSRWTGFLRAAGLKPQKAGQDAIAVAESRPGSGFC